MADAGNNTVTPIDTATNTAGTPITGRSRTRVGIAITPNGATALRGQQDTTHGYADQHRHQHPGDPDHRRTQPSRHRHHTHGATAYVTDGGTNTVRRSIPPPTPPDPDHSRTESGGIAITPNGATAYVANALSDTVTPIDTATNTAGTPITVGAVGRHRHHTKRRDRLCGQPRSELLRHRLRRSTRPPTPPVHRSRSAVARCSSPSRPTGLPPM